MKQLPLLNLQKSKIEMYYRNPSPTGGILAITNNTIASQASNIGITALDRRL